MPLALPNALERRTEPCKGDHLSNFSYVTAFVLINMTLDSRFKLSFYFVYLTSVAGGMLDMWTVHLTEAAHQ